MNTIIFSAYHLATLSHPLAVVPIFVNAGAALLPAVIAGITSLVALILSPKAMLVLLRRKPWLPFLLLAIGALLYYSPRIYSQVFPPISKPKAAAPIDWPAIARDILAQQSSPHAILTQLWHNDLQSTNPYSSPTIHNSILYLPTTLRDISGQSGSLFAIDARTGKQLWVATKINEDDYLKPFFSSPSVTADGSRLLVGQGLHADFNSPLLCFDLTKSASDKPAPIVWAVSTPLHVESSPAIFTKNGRQLVVVGAGAIEGDDRLAIGNPGFVFCVDIATGQQLWQHPVNDPESSPAVDEDGNVYIGSGFNGNAVVAIRSDPDLKGQSRQIWKTPTQFPGVGDVTLADSTALGKIVLIGGGNGDYVYSDPSPAGIVLALNRSTGKILWQSPLPDAVLGRLKVTADNALILAPCRDGNAYALSLDTGKILWHTPISSTPKIPLLAGLATDGLHTFALAADGTLAVLSTSTGQLLERTKLSDEKKSPQNLSISTPLYDPATKTLYIATETTGLHAYKINP